MTQIRTLERQTVRIIFLFTETFWDIEFRHDRSVVDVVNLHFLDNLLRVGERLGDIAEYLRHLFRRFEPFLLRVVHSVDIIDVVVGTQANQPVMGLCIFFVHEVRVIGRNDLHAVLTRQINQNRIDLFLPLIHLYIRTGLLRLMAL